MKGVSNMSCVSLWSMLKKHISLSFFVILNCKKRLLFFLTYCHILSSFPAFLLQANNNSQYRGFNSFEFESITSIKIAGAQIPLYNVTRWKKDLATIQYSLLNCICLYRAIFVCICSTMAPQSHFTPLILCSILLINYILGLWLSKWAVWVCGHM